MNCRDVREIADSFLSEELLTETNHEILRHLDTCPVCRTELDGRRRVRGALRHAFNRAPDLQPSPEFETRLRAQLRNVSHRRTRSWPLSGRWLGLAAALALAVGLASIVLMKRTTAPAETLARDAVGDHQNCALNYRLVKRPMPLERAAEQFDSAYRLLLSAPPDHISTPEGAARVTERHSCAYGARRFGHVIMEYRGRVVSLLMTADDSGARDAGQDAIPHVIGRPLHGLSVVSVNSTRHAILLVSDLDSAALRQLSRTVSLPLVRQLDAAAVTTRTSAPVALFAPILIPPSDAFVMLATQEAAHR
jgi:hypothetical protein